MLLLELCPLALFLLTCWQMPHIWGLVSATCQIIPLAATSSQAFPGLPPLPCISPKSQLCTPTTATTGILASHLTTTCCAVASPSKQPREQRENSQELGQVKGPGRGDWSTRRRGEQLDLGL